jgi:hypothetical protein
MQSLKDGIENADEKIGTEDLETELEEIQEMLNDIRTAADVEQQEHEAKLLTEVQVYCLHCNGNHDDSMFLLCAKGGFGTNYLEHGGHRSCFGLKGRPPLGWTCGGHYEDFFMWKKNTGGKALMCRPV